MKRRGYAPALGGLYPLGQEGEPGLYLKPRNGRVDLIFRRKT